MSLISCWAQWWRHEQTETLNLRGRFEKRRLPTKCVDSSSTIGRESKNSSAVTPASGQPTTLRHTSPQAWALVSPMRSSVSKISGTSSMRSQCSCRHWRVVTSPVERPKRTERSPIARSCSDVTAPFGTRTRSMR